MDVLPTASFLISVVVMTALGLRLVLAGRRTRRLPEWAIGLGFLLQGGVAGLCTILIQTLGPDLGEARIPVAITKWVAINVGAAGVALFCWQVFRSRSRWGAVGFALVVAAGVGGFLSVLVVAPDELPRDMNTGRTGYWLGLSSRLGLYVWASIEALLYHARMRRQRALGLAGPVAVSRFLLWGLAAGFVAWVYATDVAIALGWLHPGAGAARIVQSALLLLATGANWIVFWTPDFYRRWLVGRAAPEAGA